jgi:hypothetical protein
VKARQEVADIEPRGAVERAGVRGRLEGAGVGLGRVRAIEAQRPAVGKDGADAGCRGDLVEQAAQPGAARLRIGLRPEQRCGGLARHWRGARTQEDQEA